MKRYVVFFALLLFAFGCTDTRQYDIEEVRYVTPNTYFPPEVHVKIGNTGDDSLSSAPLHYRAEYRSPNADTTWWKKQINCDDFPTLAPGKTIYVRCRFSQPHPPKDRKRNAAIYLTPIE